MALSPVLLSDFEVRVEEAEVLRAMGVPKRGGDRRDNAPPQVLEIYQSVLEEALSLVRPGAVYALSRVEELRYHQVFRGATHIALGICTIGSLLEERVARLAKSGESLRALVLDAVGSEAVESVVEQTAAKIRELAAGIGLRAGVRFSPGYGRWPLEEQRWLFSVLDGSAVGVSLNRSCIMTPRKSVSFAVRIGRDPDAPRREGAWPRGKRAGRPDANEGVEQQTGSGKGKNQ